MRKICLFILTTTCLSAPAQQMERTSENTPGLSRILENHPEADLNQDGILTEKEMLQAREKQTRQRPQTSPYKTPPSYAEVPYGEHPAMAIDFWKAASESPAPLFVWIHGGGFRSGDKKTLSPVLLQEFLKAGVSVASINYRLTDVGPYPLQMHDSARAIQLLRSKAGEWTIDKTRVAAGGGSAGSGISQWLAFHDDLADPFSDDPVARESTRLTCALPINMQSTYDPRVIQKIIPGMDHIERALPAFFGLPEDWDLNTADVPPELDAKFKEASPINHLTADDPPVFIYHSERTRVPGNIHHPNFGEHLKSAMDELHIECVRQTSADYSGSNDYLTDMVQFTLRHFDMP
jgi:acetyl esterase/lipase